MVDAENNAKKPLEYMAQQLWFLNSAIYAFGGKDFPVESYITLAYPQVAKIDNRTSAEIIEDIANRL